MTFTASNGIEVKFGDDRRMHVTGPNDFDWIRPDHQEAIREYFEHEANHKPWHDAKEGEVWAVTVGVGPTFAAKVETDAGFPRFIDLADDMSYGPRAGITAARRIWPEERP